MRYLLTAWFVAVGLAAWLAVDAALLLVEGPPAGPLARALHAVEVTGASFRLSIAALVVNLLGLTYCFMEKRCSGSS